MPDGTDSAKIATGRRLADIRLEIKTDYSTASNATISADYICLLGYWDRSASGHARFLESTKIMVGPPRQYMRGETIYLLSTKSSTVSFSALSCSFYTTVFRGRRNSFYAGGERDRPSTSQREYPVLLILKPDGMMRFCIRLSPS